MTLNVKDLSGGYGQLPVLKHVDFTVRTGTIAALIGLNGAGKSTTIKHIIGLLRPQAGEITIDGMSLSSDPEGYRQAIAYVPETPILYPELTLREHLTLAMMANGLDENLTWPSATKMLEKFRLDQKLDWFPSQFSKGMQQKVMIVAAFMTQAKLYIIDEPFTGLDPLAIHDLLELVAAKKKAGASILMSTHILATAQAYADSFIMMQAGQIKAAGDLTAIQTQLGQPGASLETMYLSIAGAL